MSKIEILQSKKILPEIAVYEKGIEQQRWYAMKNTKRVFWMFNTPLIVVHAFFACVLLYVFISLSHGNFSYGTFVAMSIASSSLGSFMLKITDGYKTLLDQFVDIEKLRDFLATTPKIKNYDTGLSFQYHAGTIAFDKVCFSYTTTKKLPVFTDLTFALESGKKTALVGMSGSGKTTLMKLIAGYLMPDHGVVRIDGQDLSTLALKNYFSCVGYLTQEPAVFDGTISENLLYGADAVGDKKAVEHKISEVLKLAKCEWVYDLSHGLDTEIGERGVRLSGGQRQRLAIAKIMLKDPKIVLLDEPTSALDSFAEEAVTEAMNNLFAGRTVVIIAHRLQTVKHADDIVVLDQGKIQERGTHQELVAANGYYARMLELQSGF